MTVYATGFDASLVSCADAATVVQEAAAIAHMASTIKALAAARAAEAKQWKAAGHRSAEEELARTTGSSVTDARDALSLGRRLMGQPEVADAARRGELSPDQATAISDAVAANPAAAGGLVSAASEGGSLADLKSQCAQAKAAAVDLEARRRDIHRRRYLRAWTNQDGEAHLAAAGNPEDIAQVMAAIAPLADAAFNTARREGRREHPDAYRFDALVQLAVDATSPAATSPAAGDDDDATTEPASANDCCGGGVPAAGDGPDLRDGSGPAGCQPSDAEAVSNIDRDRPDDRAERKGRSRKSRRPASPRPRRGSPVKLLVRVDLTTLMRGFPVPGETCDLVGYGPISVSAVNDLLQYGDPFVAAILTKGQQLAGVAHLGRRPSAFQQSALEWLYPTCAAQGCPAPALHLQTDHRIDWAKTHITLLDWLDNLCPHHHADKTQRNWSLVDGVGKRPFVPPSDPRHPRYTDQPVTGPGYGVTT